MPRRLDLPDRQKSFARENLSSLRTKNIPLGIHPKSVASSRYPASSKRGVGHRHERGGGMRWTRVRRQTIGARADGEAAWSWRSDAGAKVAKAQASLAGDGGNQAWSPGRARSKPLKPLRREGRVASAEPVVLPRAFLLHADHGYQPVPGLPCALSQNPRGTLPQSSGAIAPREHAVAPIRSLTFE
jgi:hypothetical protein